MLIKNKISVGIIINPLININHLFKQLFVGSHTTAIDKTSALCIAEEKTFLCSVSNQNVLTIGLDMSIRGWIYKLQLSKHICLYCDKIGITMPMNTIFDNN